VQAQYTDKTRQRGLTMRWGWVTGVIDMGNPCLFHEGNVRQVCARHVVRLCSACVEHWRSVCLACAVLAVIVRDMCRQRDGIVSDALGTHACGVGKTCV
jgi:hypothetical protein